MSSKHIFMAAATLSVLFFNSVAFSQHPDPTQKNTSGAIVRIKDEMHHLKQNYMELDVETDKTTFNYEEILKILNQMQGSVRLIQKMNSDPGLNQPFQHLMKDIQTFQRVAKKKDSSQIGNSMNGLYQNCFRCHLTHSNPH